MEEIMIGREMNPKEMIPEEENQEGAKIFGKLAGASPALCACIHGMPV